MIILALDTCLDACSVAAWAGGRTLASRSEPMARGHQERLAPMAAEVLAELDLSKAVVEVPEEELEKHIMRKLRELYLSDSVSTVSQVCPRTKGLFLTPRADEHLSACKRCPTAKN